MRKLFYAVVALSLFATSCAKDEAAAPEATAKTKTVTFSVKAPELKTRAAFAAGDGTQATTLYYAFYDEVGLVAGISQTGGVDFTGGSKQIEVSLVDGKSYTAIFWAQNVASGYTVTMSSALADANVAMNYGTEVANSENYDGFWAVVEEIETVTTDVELFRPFAQLNIGVTTADIAKAEAAGMNVATVKAVVENVPTTFKLADGTVVESENDVTFNWVAKGEVTIDLGNPAKNYTIYSTNYVLVGTPINSTQKSLATVNFYMSEEGTGAAEADTYKLERKWTAVPVQANYRTFIVGDILTGDSESNTHKWVVKIVPDFEDDDKVEVNPGIVNP